MIGDSQIEGFLIQSPRNLCQRKYGRREKRDSLLGHMSLNLPTLDERGENYAT